MEKILNNLFSKPNPNTEVKCTLFVENKKPENFFYQKKFKLLYLY